MAYVRNRNVETEVHDFPSDYEVRIVHETTGGLGRRVVEVSEDGEEWERLSEYVGERDRADQSMEGAGE